MPANTNTKIANHLREYWSCPTGLKIERDEQCRIKLN